VVASEVVGLSGVCAIATFDESPVEASQLEPLMRAAAYRGQDGTGIWLGRGVGLGQQILRSTGDEVAEPFVCDGVTVVADARIDNREELLASLQIGDCSTPDIALISAAYRRWGTQFADRIVGDYAIVIWDHAKRKIVAARDPMAMRTLAYHHLNRRVVLATETKQVLAAEDVQERLNEQHIGADLMNHLGRPDWTAYQDVHLLAPGHVLEVDESGLSTWRFWQPNPDHRVLHANIEDYAEHLRHLFLQSVATRMRSHRSVGILLSGGVDSCSAASTAGWLLERGQSPAPAVHASTFVFDKLVQCDERKVAKQVVNRFGFGWSHIIADRLGPLSEFPLHGPPKDEPFIGAYQTLIEKGLSACHAAGARVVLGGDRGDLVIGWPGFQYLPLLRQRRWRDLKSTLLEHRTVTGESWSSLARQQLLKPGLSAARRRVARRTRGRRLGANEEKAVPAWLSQEFVERCNLSALARTPNKAPAGIELARARRYEWIFVQLQLRGMAWSERTYAQQGLVFADPFSDRRLVEFALAVPQTAIAPPWDTTKPLMRAAMRGIMPETARREARKVVLTPLYEQGLAVESKGVVKSLLTGMAAEQAGWVHSSQLRVAYNAFLHGDRLPSAFWRALVVEWWLRSHHC
jgi:asparagine synthase (glutamine-hydrolysing)